MTRKGAKASLDQDASLMQRVASGDPESFRELVEGHLRSVLALAFRLLGSREEAEEVAQETFTRVWQTAASYEPRAKVSTWICTIAHHLAVDRLRCRRETGGCDELDDAPAPDRPSSFLIEKRIAESVQAALDALPPRQKEAITLVHYQGLRQAEAAEIMGVGLDALESLLARARRDLRRSLSPLVEPEIVGSERAGGHR